MTVVGPGAWLCRVGGGPGAARAPAPGLLSGLGKPSGLPQVSMGLGHVATRMSPVHPPCGAHTLGPRWPGGHLSPTLESCSVILGQELRTKVPTVGRSRHLPDRPGALTSHSSSHQPGGSLPSPPRPPRPHPLLAQPGPRRPHIVTLLPSLPALLPFSPALHPSLPAL